MIGRKVILTGICVMAVFCSGCESRKPLYLVTETKRQQEIYQIEQEMGYERTMESVINGYYGKEITLDTIGTSQGHKQLDTYERQTVQNAMDTFINGFYHFSYAYLPSEPTQDAYQTMTPDLAAQVRQSGRLAAWQKSLQEHHAVVTIPEALRIPEGYVEVFDSNGETLYKAYALVKLSTNGDAAYYRENPHFTLGDTLVVLWMYYDEALQLTQYTETYLMNEGTKTVFYTPNGIYEREC